MTDVQSDEGKVHFVPRVEYFDSLKSNEKYPFQREIWCIMCSVGHSSKCEEPLQTMHEILYNQMKLLIYEAEKAALMRIGHPVKEPEIVHSDILFLMRRHRVKIKRLLDYLKVMDLNRSFHNVVENDQDSTRLVQNKNSSRVGKCLQFFAEIEDCNEFTSILKENIVDVELKRKLKRKELITKFMSIEEYKKFNELLTEATFCYKGKQDLFKWWLLEGINICTRNYNISPLALTILEFLARETIINVVDMVFHIKTVRKNKISIDDDCKRKKDFCVPSRKIHNLPDEGEEEGRKINDKLNNDTEDCENLFIYRSKITKEEIIDAYMLFQMQRKPLLFLDDPYLKQTTLICLANVDDHKVP